MKCIECGGKGFIEVNAGLMRIGCEICDGTGEVDDSNSGAGEPTKDSGSGDTGKPKRTRKSKSAAKLTKKPE